MKKRWIAVLLCAALLAAFGWGQPAFPARARHTILFPGGGSGPTPLAAMPCGRSRCTSSRARCGTPGSWRSIWWTELLAGPEDAALTSAIPDGRHPAVPEGGWYPGQGGPLLPLPAALRRGAGHGGLCHHPDADPAAGDLRCQRDGTGPAAGLPGQTDLCRQGCAVFQPRRMWSTR